MEPTFAAACGTGDANTGTEKLAIFFVPKEGSDERKTAQAVRARVAAQLGITPGVVLPLPRNKFPRTTSGKIQRTSLKQALEAGAFQEALGKLEQDSRPAEGRAPQGPVEMRVAEIWREVLGLSNISAEENLFQLGGDSLKATQIIS